MLLDKIKKLNSLRIIWKTGATLDKKGASITWDSKPENEDVMNTDRLHLRQILLGHTAKENEYNVVQVNNEIIFFALDNFNFNHPY